MLLYTRMTEPKCISSEQIPPGILDFDTRDARVEDFARALFDRPIAVTAEEKERLAEGEYDPWFGDKTEFVRLCTQLFERFGELSAPYSLAQIEQGLWLVHGYPYFLPFYLTNDDVPVEAAVACVQASYHLYRDFVTTRCPHDGSAVLYMWWDEGWSGATKAFLDAVLTTLERILTLPDNASRRSALHGLAHLKQDWDPDAARAVIDRFITRERSTLSEDELEYVEFCRDLFHV